MLSGNKHFLYILSIASLRFFLPTCGTPRDQYRMKLPRCQIVQINSPDVLILYVTYIQSEPDQMHRVKISSSPDSALRSMFNINWQLVKPTHLILHISLLHHPSCFCQRSWRRLKLDATFNRLSCSSQMKSSSYRRIK